MIRSCLFDRAHQIELREKCHKVTCAHHTMDLIICVISQHLFPCCQHIRIVVKFKDEFPHTAYSLQVVFKDSSAHKTDGIFPDIVLTDELMVFAAVDDGERAFCEVVASIDSVCIFTVESPGTFGCVHEAQSVEICRLVGEGGGDRYALVAVLAGQAAAECIIPAIGSIEIIGQGEAVACLGGDQATKKFGGK